MAAIASATFTALPPTPETTASEGTRPTAPGDSRSIRTIRSCAGWSAGTTITSRTPGTPRVRASAQGLRRATVEVGRVDPGLGIRRVRVLLGDRVQPGRVVVLDGRRVHVAADRVGDELHGVIAHVERGLGDEPVVDAGLEVGDLVRRRVERHELDRAVLAGGLDRRGCAIRRGLVGGVDAC